MSQFVLGVFASIAALSDLAAYALHASRTLHEYARIDPEAGLAPFSEEMASFSQACNLVKEQLEDLTKNTDAYKLSGTESIMMDQDLMVKCTDEILECGSLNEAVEKLIQYIKDNRSKLRKKAQVAWTRQEVADLRDRLRARVAALQIFLHSVNIKSSDFGPRQVGKDVLAKLDQLSQSIDRIEASLRRQTTMPSRQSIEVGRSNLDSVVYVQESNLSTPRSDQTKGMERLLPVMNTPEHNSRQLNQWFKRMTINDAPVEISSIATPATNEPSVFSTRSESTSTAATDVSVQKRSTESRRPAYEKIVDSGPREPTPAADLDRDSDDEFDVGLARSFLSAGRKSFTESAFINARLSLVECKSRRNRMSAKKRESICSDWELDYLLAICSFQIDERLKAQDDLLDALSKSPSSDLQRQQLFDISHLLSIIYFFKMELERALETCENTLRGRWNLLGKDHMDCYLSLALMYRICELMDLDTRAQSYLDMIPEAERKFHLRLYHDLAPDDDLQAPSNAEKDSQTREPAPTASNSKRPILPHRPATVAFLNQISPTSPPLGSTNFRPPSVPLVGTSGSSSPFEPQNPRVDSPYLQHSIDSLPQGWEIRWAQATPDQPPRPYYVDHNSKRTTWLLPSRAAEGDFEETRVSTEATSLAAPLKLRRKWLDQLWLLPVGDIQEKIGLSNTEEALILLQRGQTDSPSGLGLTALHLAVLFGDHDMVSELLNRGANVHAECEVNSKYLISSVSKLQPVHIAAAMHRKDLLELLICDGATLRDSEGQCDLPMFVLHPSWIRLLDFSDPADTISTFGMLQKLGLDIKERLPNGLTSLQIAQSMTSSSARRTKFWKQITDFLASAN